MDRAQLYKLTELIVAEVVRRIAQEERRRQHPEQVLVLLADSVSFPEKLQQTLNEQFGVAYTPVSIPETNTFADEALLYAGKLEPGEDPVAGALRELKEETGAVPDTFLPMGVTLPSPGCLSERLYLFLAKGLHMESQQLDEDEFLNVERIPFNEMVHRVMDGEIEDSKTIAAVLKAKVLLNL